MLSEECRIATCEASHFEWVLLWWLGVLVLAVVCTILALRSVR